MWSRAQLKDKAKFTFKRNYWKVVLVSTIFLLLGGGSGNVFNFEGRTSTDNSNSYFEYYEEEHIYDLEDAFSHSALIGIGAMAGIVFLVVFIVVFAIALLLSTFILNPIEVGCKRFFFKNLNETAEVKEIAFAFDNHYKNVITVLFFRNLYTALWSLLFVIPGIVKSYEYRMMPYLLAENPAMSKEQAFALSKQMMDGQKWDTFVLDLSFFGWRILSTFTFGILNLFYVTPYVNMTDAALYESLCYSRNWTAYRGPQTTQDNTTNE